VSRGMQEAVETSAGEIRVGEAEGRRSKGRDWKKKLKKEKIIEIKKVVEEWEIWDEEEEAARLKDEVKKLVPKKFH